jgi:hypothetical protein
MQRVALGVIRPPHTQAPSTGWKGVLPAEPRVQIQQRRKVPSVLAVDAVLIRLCDVVLKADVLDSRVRNRSSDFGNEGFTGLGATVLNFCGGAILVDLESSNDGLVLAFVVPIKPLIKLQLEVDVELFDQLRFAGATQANDERQRSCHDSPVPLAGIRVPQS